MAPGFRETGNPDDLTPEEWTEMQQEAEKEREKEKARQEQRDREDREADLQPTPALECFPQQFARLYRSRKAMPIDRPETLPAQVTDGFQHWQPDDRTGTMFMYTPGTGMWQEYWFHLIDHCLFFAESEEAHYPLGVLLVDNCAICPTDINAQWDHNTQTLEHPFEYSSPLAHIGLAPPAKPPTPILLCLISEGKRKPLAHELYCAMRDGQVGEEEKGRVNDSMAATHATATVGLESLADEGDGTLVWLAFRRVETRDWWQDEIANCSRVHQEFEWRWLIRLADQRYNQMKEYEDQVATLTKEVAALKTQTLLPFHDALTNRQQLAKLAEALKTHGLTLDVVSLDEASPHHQKKDMQLYPHAGMSLPRHSPVHSAHGTSPVESPPQILPSKQTQLTRPHLPTTKPHGSPHLIKPPNPVPAVGRVKKGPAGGASGGGHVGVMTMMGEGGVQRSKTGPETAGSKGRAKGDDTAGRAEVPIESKPLLEEAPPSYTYELPSLKVLQDSQSLPHLSFRRPTTTSTSNTAARDEQEPSTGIEETLGGAEGETEDREEEGADATSTKPHKETHLITVQHKHHPPAVPHSKPKKPNVMPRGHGHPADVHVTPSHLPTDRFSIPPSSISSNSKGGPGAAAAAASISSSSRLHAGLAPTVPPLPRSELIARAEKVLGQQGVRPKGSLVGGVGVGSGSSAREGIHAFVGAVGEVGRGLTAKAYGILPQRPLPSQPLRMGLEGRNDTPTSTTQLHHRVHGTPGGSHRDIKKL
ncbi:unnamed protein product [Vitrella brassicaformis CCMP3155]|uniref:Uncharacterized protein n=1 Tax=Vitrella brassicaformis (strain CCMP3155) TaxID=1169540 RepID=A0A0G4FHV7_VITBC|nr:unnamed protein product [Vitrella brassicaformis CCMP3155]|eukprot:CEM13037.1 unnamed protein product [Vitrella brassicaformis CCMP3155]